LNSVKNGAKLVQIKCAEHKSMVPI